MSIKRQGWNAFFAGETANPFPGGSLKHRFWADGWKKAKKHCLPLKQSDLSPAKSAPAISEFGSAGKKVLASTSGMISALKTFRETAKSWYVTYHGEGDKEVRISKTDPRRRIFDNMQAAEDWAMGVSA